MPGDEYPSKFRRDTHVSEVASDLAQHRRERCADGERDGIGEAVEADVEQGGNDVGIIWMPDVDLRRWAVSSKF
jgi:hypothetical protein